jgi:hypothetical protein
LPREAGKYDSISLRSVSETAKIFRARFAEEETPRVKMALSFRLNHDGSIINETSWMVVTPIFPANGDSEYWVWIQAARALRAARGNWTKLHHREDRLGNRIQ